MNEKDRFGGVHRLYGEAAAKKLQNARVGIVGLGGVGCWVAEMLARSGVGYMQLIDADDVCVTNINRQIHALDSTVGQSKVEAISARIHDINPACEVDAKVVFFLPSTAEQLLETPVNIMVDAIDSVKHKVLLLSECKKRGIQVITAGGAGGKTNPALIQEADLNKTYGDRLLKKVRLQLRTELGISANKKSGINAVFTPQEMKLPNNNDASAGLRLDCNTGYGTSATVISSMGIRIADKVIQSLIKK